VGIGCCLAAAMLVMPLLLALSEALRARRDARGGRVER
jgi:hypothetical protein